MPDFITNAMTVDVEDYFHVTAFANTVDRSRWNELEYRAVRNTERVLELFDASRIKATFFVLGWVAKRSPDLVKKIQSAGHEIACHGMSHQLVYKQTPEVFHQETRDAKQLLEDITGTKVRGYRAASYSIIKSSLWALDILESLGFEYDSSIFPVRHDIYGMRHAPRTPFNPGVGKLLEVPLTTVEVMGNRLPCGGGGYFRIFPYALFKMGLRRVNEVDGLPGIFYFHPWEIDPGQPRLPAGWKSRFRHYYNLQHTEARLQQLLKDFSWGRMDEVFLSATRNQSVPVVSLALGAA
jgi:polysaccharide deacetylase family protein (PEP-CTERM system associated)